MECEYPQGCQSRATVRIGEARAVLPLCRLHAAVAFFKILMDKPNEPLEIPILIVEAEHGS